MLKLIISHKYWSWVQNCTRENATTLGTSTYEMHSFPIDISQRFCLDSSKLCCHLYFLDDIWQVGKRELLSQTWHCNSSMNLQWFLLVSQDLEVSWGLPLVIIHPNEIFPEKNHPFWGAPMTMEIPIRILSCPVSPPSQRTAEVEDAIESWAAKRSWWNFACEMGALTRWINDG